MTAEQLKQIMDYYHLSQTELSKRVGVTAPAISHIILGRNGISSQLVEKIQLAFPALDEKWLQTGEGDMLKSVGDLKTFLQACINAYAALDEEEQKIVNAYFQKAIRSIGKEN